MFWRARKSREQDLEKELRSHLELEAEERQDPSAARRALGNVTRIKEEVREAWGWTSIGRLGQDMRYASRVLRKNPGFSAVAICTLALGMGATTAIFSLTDVVLLRPLPYPDSKRLVRVWQSEPKMGEARLGTAPPEFAAYREHARAFSSLAGYQLESFDLTGEGEPEHITAYRITSSLFSTLGVAPFLGRAFAPPEELPGAARVVVLSFNSGAVASRPIPARSENRSV